MYLKMRNRPCANFGHILPKTPTNSTPKMHLPSLNSYNCLNYFLAVFRPEQMIPALKQVGRLRAFNDL